MNLDELALVDILEDLAEGEALDLTHASYAFEKSTKIRGGSDYRLLKGSDLIIITAGAARKPGMSRLDLLKKNASIIKQIAERLKEVYDGGVMMLVTNPVDLMTYVFWRESGLPRGKVMGMGGVLDTSRLWSLVGAKSDDLVLGEHGDGMFVHGSHKDLEDELKGLAMKVIERKGATIYGPAASIYKLAKAVLTDSREVLPVSAILDGEYGLKNVAIGVPASIGREGILEIIELEDVREELSRSASTLMDKLREIGYP